MKKEKRMLALCITMLLCFSGIVLPERIVRAEEETKTTVDGWEYTVFNQTNTIKSVTITGYTGSATELTIPAKIDGMSVTSIGDSAFYWCRSLTSIDIPESVTSIGGSAFFLCIGLTSIDIPEGVKYIGSDAFAGCSSLTSIDISEGVAGIGSGAFRGCSSLTSIDIPEGVSYIGGEYAFEGCSSLRSIDIPEDVTSIGTHAFADCSSLTSINIPEGVTYIGYDAFEGCSSLRSINIPEGVTVIRSKAFRNCSSLMSIDIPEGVSYIGGEQSFEGCSSLRSIDIPEDVTSIGSWAFAGCSSLTSINIPKGVMNIEYEAFKGCSSLTSIDIPASVNSIGLATFADCNRLQTITVDIENTEYMSYNNALYSKDGKKLIQGCKNTKELLLGMTEIGSNAFEGCSSLTNINIPATVKRIGYDAFSYCSSLTSINIPASVTSICSNAFIGCSRLEMITVDIGNTEYMSYNNALYSKDGKKLIQGLDKTGVLLSGVTEIEFSAFQCCSGLTSIDIPASVTSIGSCAFRWCSGLTSINIPVGVTYIGMDAFCGCIALTDITIPESVVEIGEGVFRKCDNLTIHTPAGSYAAQYAEEIGIPFDNIMPSIQEPTSSHVHTPIADAAVASTCTAVGKTEGSHCSVCGEIIKAQENIPATGHAYEQTITKATAKKNGRIVERCSECDDVKSETPIFAASNITLSKSSFVYNGKKQKPDVKLRDNQGNTLSSDCYDITYQKTGKKVGEYAISVTLKGNYSDTVKLTYQIVPKGTAISKLTAKKKGFTIKWKKQTTETTGYQIQYSTSSSFKGARTVIISRKKTTSNNIAKLKGGKKYYVRIRTYKIVKVNGKNTKLYSGWSKAKAVNTKK